MNHAKELRKSIRNVMQEVGADILSQEAVNVIYKQLQKEIEFKLTTIDQGIKDALRQMEDRQKDVYSLLVREMAAQQKFTPAQAPAVTNE